MYRVCIYEYDTSYQEQELYTSKYEIVAKYCCTSYIILYEVHIIYPRYGE